MMKAKSHLGLSILLILLAAVACEPVTPPPTIQTILSSSPSPSPSMIFPIHSDVSSLLPSFEPITMDNVKNLERISLQNVSKLGTGYFSQAVFSPKGDLIAIVSTIGIYLYTADLSEKIDFMATDYPVFKVIFSPDGSKLASLSTAPNSSTTTIVTLWEVTSRQILKVFSETQKQKNCIAFSTASDWLAIGFEDSTIVLWNVLDEQTPVRILRAHTSAVTSLAFSPDGRTLASGSKDKTFILWDLRNQHRPVRLPSGGKTVTSIAFSVDGKTIAIGLENGIVNIWRVVSASAGNEQPLASRRMTDIQIINLYFSLDGSILASNSIENTVSLSYVTNPYGVPSNFQHDYGIKYISISPDWKRLVSCSIESIVTLWDLDSGEMLNTLTGTNVSSNLAFSPDGGSIAASGSEPIFLWSLDRPDNASILRGNVFGVYEIAFSPDGNTLASGSYDAKVALWSADNGLVLRILEGHLGGVSSVAFSENGELLASGSFDKTVILWDIANGSIVQTLSGHSRTVNDVAFSHDGKILASGSGDKTIILWDVTTGQIIRTLFSNDAEITQVVFSPTGNTLASGSTTGTITLWNAESGNAVWINKQITKSIAGIAFSPDGKILATVSNQNNIMFWIADKGSFLSSLSGLSNRMRSVAFSPDGKILAAGSEDRAIWLWGISP